MGEEDLYDAHLVGTDGEEVPCSKAILATISPVFRKMFFKGYREQTADRCNLNFHSVVIALIVKYCYCGEVDMDSIFDKNRTLEEEASLLVEVREAGGYFEIEDLSSAAAAKIGNLVFPKNTADKKKYQHASAFLMALFKCGEDSGPLWLQIYRFALGNTMECFGLRDGENDSTTGSYADPRLLARVLENTKDTFAVVRCIQTWASLDSKSTGNSYSDEEKRSLLKLAEDIDLKSLDTSELANIKPCSLFSSERILEAFVHHCKKSDENTSETPRTKRGKLYVSGAEMKYLNGYYKESVKNDMPLNIFKKQVEHNGITCKSIIHRKHGESKWLISIADNNWKLCRSDLEVADKSIQMHVYELSYQSLPNEDPNKLPPFHGWKCVEGTGPGPFVACNIK